ncbi:AAA family ATPase [Nocardiopsis sp. CNT-189]|uniref:AAA domain-containing protein n=1 Tax=Nocardiopsis oceanisediminis TaxID=2816862 RepID=UPI003B2B6486
MPENADRRRFELVNSKVEEWASDLIDLGPRNALVKFKGGRKSSLELAGCEQEALSGFFSGKKTGLHRLFQDEARFQDAVSRVRSLHRKVRELAEEQGVDVARVAFGLVEVTGERRRRGSDRPLVLRSPLLLQQVAFEARSVADKGLCMQLFGETEINPVLLHALRRGYSLDIDTERFTGKVARILDEQVDRGEQTRSVFDELRQLAAEQGVDLALQPSAVVGMFNYEKFAMVQDLQGAADLLAGNDLVAALAGDSSAVAAIRAEDGSPTFGDVDTVRPEEEFLVLDADSSQHRAVDAALSKRYALIEGPPGTGKSQAIANIIAGAAARGKRVLFVAEKRAAIEAVTNRLADAGLGDLVLDAHRLRGSRRHLAQQFAESLDRIPSEPPVEAADTHARLMDRRRRLAAYAREFHADRAPWGISHYEVRARLLGSESGRFSVPAFPRDRLDALNAEVVQRAADELRGFVEKGGLRLVRKETPWCHAEVSSAEEAEKIHRRLSDLVERKLTRSSAEMRALLSRAGLEVPDDLAAWEKALELLDRAEKISDRFGPELFGEDLEELCGATAPWSQRARFPRRPSWWRRRTLLKSLRRSGIGAKAELHGQMLEAAAVCDRWREMGGAQGRPGKIEGLAEAGGSYRELRRELTAVAMVTNSDDLRDSRPERLRTALGELHGDQEMLFYLPGLNQSRALFSRLGMDDLLAEIAERGATPDEAVSVFWHTWLRSLDQRFRFSCGTLREFNGVQHERVAAEFRDVDREHRETTARRVRRRVAFGLRKAMDDFPGQAELIRKQAAKRTRHLSMRKQVEQASEMMMALRPCWAMSPLVVSQVLPARRLFDLVVFDEASQVQPHDAITSIMRGERLVVAGDDHQLPPSSWFTRLLADDDDTGEEQETELRDYESILGALNGFLPPSGRHRLRWHYRSRDERLIAFSNREIYGNDLVTFPGPEQEDPLRLEVVDGTVPPGRNGSSSVEARRVAELVLEHAEQRPDESLGVITLGDPHRARIEQAVREARRERTDLEDFFTEEGGASSRFFVKNIETVQGDERDAIVLSIGVAKAATGRIDARGFGPLNREGGKRRLNVAVTRAKRRMTVVSSFPPAALAPSDRETGTELLRRFLETAAAGGDPDASGRSTGGELNGFEADIARRLSSKGIPVYPQWGFSGFRIDFALAHPDEPGRMVLAVEADGDTYHRAPSARDRDRLRQEHLERLGWRFHRVWASAWFADPEREAERIADAWRSAASSPPPRQPERTEPVPQDRKPAGGGRSAGAVRGPRPEVAPGLGIGAYGEQELIALCLWLLEDGLQLSRDERIKQAMTELGFRKRGRKIVARLQHVMEIAQHLTDQKES